MSLWALDYLNQHLLAPHRTGGSLGDKEGVRLRYAELRIQAFAGRSVLYRAARRADGPDNSVNEVIAAKVFCTEVASTIIDWGRAVSGRASLGCRTSVGSALSSGALLTTGGRR